ncbi:MAG: glycosyltransferase family 4 protein [Pseudorhodoplanes sp.]|uniref:glycosyltransferase family 4 protein n=1 Tax=Pseudorhodoplanes sp. TaxID=1934341 RepID=UPI003D0D69F0
MAVLVDISRLIETLHLRTPTGIDRVEMAYAQHFLRAAEKEDVRFVVTWPAFSGVLDARYAGPLIEEASSHWLAGQADPAQDRTLQALSQVLHDEPAPTAKAPIHVGPLQQRKDLPHRARRAATWARSALRPLAGRLLSELRDSGCWYIHVSQFRLHRALRFAWMNAARARGLFMLHDLIPVLHPEYCRPGEADRRQSGVDTMVARASVIVANSEYTRRSLLGHFGEQNVPRCEVIALGVASAFETCRHIAPVEARVPYFVVVGTIEPRKNLEFLLTLWRRWTDNGNTLRARLVVVGNRGWEIENVSNMLDRSVSLAPTVIEAHALGDTGMIALLRGAAALIAPSWVEGFGLPVAEALALGTPVLASDIEAHREVGGAFAEYISPVDGPGWVQALEDYASPHSERRLSRIALLRNYRPPTWQAHMARVEDLLRER